jgi:hypothetical protein
MAHRSLERSPPIVKTMNLRKAPVRQVKVIMTTTATPVMRTCLVAMNQVTIGMIWKRRLPNVCSFFFFMIFERSNLTSVADKKKAEKGGRGGGSDSDVPKKKSSGKNKR